MSNRVLQRISALNPLRPRPVRVALPRAPRYQRAELVRGAWPFMLVVMFVLLPVGAGAAGAQDGSTLRQLVLGTLFLAGLFTIVRFPDRWAQIPRAVPLSFALLVGYTLLSAFWSPEPWISVRRSAQVVGVAIVALAIVIGGMGKHRVHRLLALPMLFGVALAIGVTAAFPDFAFAENGLRGFTFTKNNFGQFCAMVVFIGMAWSFVERRFTAFWLGVVLLALVGLAFSRSITTILALLAVTAASSLVLVARLIHSSWMPVALVAAMLLLAGGFVAGLVFGFPAFETVLETALKPTGRDLTLTGRTYLWELMVAEAMRHPWFGTGYGSFWLGLEGRSGQIAMLVGWGYPGQAHNGYLDIFNELGIVGLALTAALLAQHSRNLSLLFGLDRRAGFFHAGVLLFVVMLNVAEAALLRTTNPWWMLLVASIFEVSWRTAPLRSERRGSAVPRANTALAPSAR